ncbi:hypothetical protein BC628DRAFT_29810 [Trametes gibbosa]|nr:hypothetical protein BC628DRAFT_29810 [Trametes gibbosa]
MPPSTGGVWLARGLSVAGAKIAIREIWVLEYCARCIMIRACGKGTVSCVSRNDPVAVLCGTCRRLARTCVGFNDYLRWQSNEVCRRMPGYPVPGQHCPGMHNLRARPIRVQCRLAGMATPSPARVPCLVSNARCMPDRNVPHASDADGQSHVASTPHKLAISPILARTPEPNVIVSQYCRRHARSFSLFPLPTGASPRVQYNKPVASAPAGTLLAPGPVARGASTQQNGERTSSRTAQKVMHACSMYCWSRLCEDA